MRVCVPMRVPAQVCACPCVCVPPPPPQVAVLLAIVSNYYQVNVERRSDKAPPAFYGRSSSNWAGDGSPVVPEAKVDAAPKGKDGMEREVALVPVINPVATHAAGKRTSFGSLVSQGSGKQKVTDIGNWA